MGLLLTVFLPLSLAVIMFSLGLGLTVDDFRRVLIRPFAFGVGALNQVILLPVVAFALAIAFRLPPELAVGFMILAFCPGGVTTNILTKFAHGEVALSVSLTAIISLLSTVTVPLLVAWSVTYFMGKTAPAIDVTRLAFSMFLITAVPVLIGVAVRRFATGFADRTEPVFSKLAGALFVIIIIGALAANWSVFVDNLARLAPALISLNVALLLIGTLSARALGLTGKEVKTVAIETGIQNGTLGITVGSLIVESASGLPPFSLPSAVYGITMYLVTLPIIYWFRTRGTASS